MSDGSPSVPPPSGSALLDQIAALADELQLDHLRGQIAACRARLAAPDRLDVAVIGRFKSGKSSFLNHFAARNILPVAAVPATAVITRMRPGASDRVEVQFLDGAVRAISPEEVSAYVSEGNNPGNAKRVASVEIELRSLAPFAPLQFVDTPGLGSALAHNTAVALDWLPNVGVALVLVSCDAPLAQDDLTLLNELRRHTPKIVLLLTKADLLNASQRREVLAFIEERIRREWEVELPVFFFSVLSVEADLAARFEHEVLQPLLRQGGGLAGQIVWHKLWSLSEQTLDLARVALAAAAQTESARAALRDRLADERRQLGALRRELEVLAFRRSASLLERWLARLEPAGRALQIKVASALHAELGRWPPRVPGSLRQWRHWLRGFLSRELTALSGAEAGMFCEPLLEAREQLRRTIQGFQDRLRKHVDTALGISLPAREIVLEPQVPKSPPLDVAFALDPAANLLAFLLPFALIRSRFERWLLRKTSYEVDKNLSRLAAAWRDPVAREIDALTRQTEQLLLDELADLEQAVSAPHPDTLRLQSRIAELEASVAGDPAR